MTKKNKHKYLKLVGNTWIFQRRIPKKIRKHFGDVSTINKSLKTDSLRQAIRLRDTYIAHMHDLMRAEEAGPSYAKLADQYKGLSKEQLQELASLSSEELSGNFPWAGHPEGENLPQPTDDELLELRTIQSLMDENTSSIKDKYRLTLKQSLKAIQREKTDLPQRSLMKYDNSVRTFLTWLGKDDIYVYVINRGLVRNFITSQKEKDKKVATISNYLSNLGTIWGYVRDQENLRDANPFKDHRQHLGSRKKRKKYFENWTADELRLVIDNLSKTEDKLPVYIAWYTGSRLDEIYSLLPSDIREDKQSKIWYISFKEWEDGKNEYATRQVPIHQALKKHLRNFKGFTRSSSAAYGKYFGRVKQDLGFPAEKTFHSIRGNTSTNLANEGVPEYIANQIVGHSKGETFTYSYYSEGLTLENLHKYVNKLPKL